MEIKIICKCGAKFETEDSNPVYKVNQDDNASIVIFHEARLWLDRHDICLKKGSLIDSDDE